MQTVGVSWTLTIADHGELLQPEQLLGTLPDLPCRVELHRAGAEGFVLSHSCTGTFEVRGATGAEIRFAACANAPVDLVRADVLSRVLSVAMHTQDVLALHASAVALPEGAIAFLAPKGFGKSTIALSLAQRGAAFVTDDVLPVRVRDRCTVHPGVQSVRLRSDSALRLINDHDTTRQGIDGKRIVDRLPSEIVASGPAPLIAIYLLSPTPNVNGTPVVARSRLSPRRAVQELLRHAKIGALLGGSEAPRVLQQAANIASVVPAYLLEIAHDLHRLSDAVVTIADWHGASPSR